MIKKLEKQVEELLDIAQVRPDRRDKARHDVQFWLYLASSSSDALRSRKNPQDHNDYFLAIQKSAESLIAAIHRIEIDDDLYREFWWYSILCLGPNPTEISPDAVEPEHVFDMLDKIVTAACEARVSRMGRPRQDWKQVLVTFAYRAFEAIASSELRPSEYAASPFYRFVKTFCEVAGGSDVGSITLQIRNMIKSSRSQQK